MDPRALVLAHTRIAACPTCPEIRLRLVMPDCPLWRADEGALAALGIGEPFWGFAWPGGQALARYLLDHPTEVAGLRVLDAGAGGGVEAVAAALAGAREVVALDADPLSACAVELNAALNGVRIRTWTGDYAGYEGPCDVVLAGDLTYERTGAPRALGWLARRAALGQRALLAEPRRGFVDRAGLRSLATYRTPADCDPHGRCAQDAEVFAIDGLAKAAHE
ncbi:MAG: methyltransferase [Deltaproteobacteria bacterium]|nr:methyltransferase [Deltaproteobacteria bacterium]